MSRPEIAVVSNSTTLPQSDLAFMVKGVAAQVEECAAAWGIEPVPVVLYKRGDTLPFECRLMTVSDSIGMSGVLGYHDDFGGIVYAEVMAQGEHTGITLSHEAIEELVDPTCNAWRELPDGTDTALEVADACEGDSYAVPVTIMGETRTVLLSNYLLPSWFNQGEAPFDKLGLLTAAAPAQRPGGYIIVRGKDGVSPTCSPPVVRRTPASGSRWRTRGHGRCGGCGVADSYPRLEMVRGGRGGRHPDAHRHHGRRSPRLRAAPAHRGRVLPLRPPGTRVRLLSVEPGGCDRSGGAVVTAPAIVAGLRASDIMEQATRTTQRLFIPGHLPGMNEVVEAAKGAGGRGARYATMKRQWTELVWALAKSARLRPVKRARLAFLWIERDKRRDLDNIAAAKKFVNDGLVNAGILSGDGWAGVVGFSDEFAVDPGRHGVEVTIEEVP
jgi:hypothetical protein